MNKIRDADNSTDTENEEEQQTGDTSDDEKDTSSSDSESVKLKDTQTQSQSYCHISCDNLFIEATVSTAVEICSVSDEVKPKVVESSLQVSSVEESSELKTDSKCLYYPHVNSI